MMGSNESFDITNPILDNEIVQIYYINHDAYIQRADDCGKQMASTALDFIPVVGEAKAGIETVYEKDLITGYEYSDGERVFMGSCILFAEYAKLLGKVDDVGEIVKHADDFKGGSKTGLLDELASSGVKYNADDVVAITKKADGKLVWLESGNSNAGLEHIMQHADQFASKGISCDKIPDFIMHALEDGKVVGAQRTRIIYEVMYEGKLQRVAISVGDNGFIVGANPKSIP